MLRSLLTAILLMTAATTAQAQATTRPATDRPRVAIAVHGGAGTIRREDLTPELDAQYRATLEEALRAGERVLLQGRPALDAVEAAIVVLEDSPLFNAGKGAVFTSEGRCELDASVMDGGTGRAGAVAAVTNVKNPIKAARAVMERSVHVLLAGVGAETFAAEIGLNLVPNEYFHTDRRREALQKIKEREAGQEGRVLGIGEGKFGTVGCVALDVDGNLAAGTSTGGLTNKRFGRVGDSPVVGAGTWADSRVAVSCTGQGEFFLRLGVARDIAARVEYLGEDAATAADCVVQRLTDAGGQGGQGGLVVLDADGRASFPMNTPGMYRGAITVDGEVHVTVYADEDAAVSQ